MCRRRVHSGMLCATKFGDTITPDHQTLNEEGEPRNNHRYAIVVQDFDTQWIQSCLLMENKNITRNDEEHTEVSQSEIQSKVAFSANSVEFGKACEDLRWNHCTSTSHRSETSGIAERAVRGVKEATTAILL